MTIPVIDTMALMERYEVLLLDVYGVLLTHHQVIPGAIALLQRLEERGHPYLILTNDASRSITTTARRLAGHGLPVAPERIITSGSLIAACFQQHHLQGAGCLVLGPDDSRSYVAEAGGVLREPGEDADVLVICDEEGYPFLEVIDATLSLLFRKMDQGEPPTIILANPDTIYPKGNGSFGICSGSIALVLEDAVRKRYPHAPPLPVIRLGKPYPPIFAEALRRSGTRNMVMVGDQLETDIRGALDFGLDAALVPTGVTNLSDRVTEEMIRPTWLLPHLDPDFPRND